MIKHRKNNDKFWRESFMKVLEAMYHHELSWSSENWAQYGVNSSDKQRIEAEFQRFIGEKQSIKSKKFNR